MKHGLFRALAVVSASALLAGTTGVASADNLENDELGSGGTTTIAITGGTARTTIHYFVHKTGNRCDAADGSPAVVTIAISNNASGAVTRSPAGNLTFTKCDESQAVVFTATAAGSYAVTARVTDTDNGGDSYKEHADFTLSVTAPANAAPTVNVTGVSHGSSYEHGAVPPASCNVIDDQPAPTFAAALSPISGPLASYGLGTRTASCSYTDAGGLSDTDSATYSIIDSTKPTLNVPGDQTVEATGPSGATASYLPAAEDNVALAAGSPSCTPASGSTFAKGQTTVNCTATDVAGNVSSGSFKVTVVDTTDPTLVVGNDVTVEATGPGGAIATYEAATASDTVDGALTPTCLPASGSVFQLGDTTVHCSVSDSASNTASGSLTVHVVDTTAPELTVPDDLVREATSAAGASVSYSTSASDLVDGPRIPVCDRPSGSVFPIGSTTVTCTVADTRGNGTSDSFTVTVSDTTKPELTLPENITEEATGPTGATVTFIANAVDVVDGTIVVSCIPESGSLFELGTTTVSCTAADAAGNEASGSFTITVQDTTAPAVTVPSEVIEEATGPDGAAVTFAASALDIVDGDVATTCSPASGSTFDIGTTEVECSATDASGNTGSERFDVTVRDTTPPAVTAPDNQVLEAVNASGASATFTATATDLVDGVVDTTCDPASGSTFPIGTTAVVCTATDAAGNTGSDSFEVKVEDTTAPEIAVPDNMFVEATGPTGATVTFSASATDAVTDNLTTTCDPASGSTFAIATTSVDCEATDEAGNTGHGGFTVTVQDTTQPTVNVPEDKTVEATGPSGAVVDFTVDSTDIVDGTKVASCSPAGGSTFPLGTTTVICTRTDAAGNTGEASFKVTVEDTTAPDVTVPANQIAEATGPGGAVVVFSASAADLVDGTVATACTPASGSTFALGTVTVHCSATDVAGNTGSASFTVKVQDTTKPSLTLPDNLTREATGPSGAAVTYAASAIDLVDGSIAPECTPASGASFALGNTTVNCSATDAAGNTAEGSFSVKVQDTTGPALSLPSNIAVGATSAAGAVVTYPAATASDLVDGSVSVTCTPPSGSTFAPGVNTVTCSATDAAGNRSEGTFKITVTFGWNGFFAPVDNNGVLNAIKNGQTVPLKWNIPNGSGGYISSLDVVQRIAQGVVACNATAPVDDVETTATGGTVLRYDSTANQYIYNWQTPKAPGKCYSVTVALTDGSAHFALFKLK